MLDPATIERLNDRAADNWVPLIQVAKLAGQVWLDNALKAMAALNPQEGDSEPESRDGHLGPAVLTRLRRIFYDAVQVPAMELAEAKARAADKSEEEIEAARKDAAQNVSPKDDLFIPTSEILEKHESESANPSRTSMGAGTPLTRSTKSLKLRGDVPIRYIALTMYYSPPLSEVHGRTCFQARACLD